MLKSCGIEVLEKFIPKEKEVWLSLKTMTSILRDAGYRVKPYRVEHGMRPPIVNIGFSKEHYYILDDLYGGFPEVVFLTEEERIINKNFIREISEEEAERIKGGKGGMNINPVNPPPQPTTGQSIQDWVDMQPQVWEQQQQYAPLEAQQQVELAQQYAQPMGEAYASAQKAMYPETSALQEQMAGKASVGMEQGLSDSEKEQYTSTMNANLGRNVGSGIGADYMSRGMLQQQQGRQDYFSNMGLSLAGNQPLAQPSAPSPTNYMSQFGPQQPMNMATGTYGPYAAASRPFSQTNKGGFMGWLGM